MGHRLFGVGEIPAWGFLWAGTPADVSPLAQLQYFCTVGSISSAQAKMPPARLATLG